MLKSLTAVAAGALALTMLSPVAVLADSYWEVEHARANARAGGPVSARDAELLERYGCLSGTKSAFCKRLSARDKRLHRDERRRKRSGD
jgi:hypothetical protein